MDSNSVPLLEEPGPFSLLPEELLGEVVVRVTPPRRYLLSLVNKSFRRHCLNLRTCIVYYDASPVNIPGEVQRMCITGDLLSLLAIDGPSLIARIDDVDHYFTSPRMFSLFHGLFDAAQYNQIELVDFILRHLRRVHLREDEPKGFDRTIDYYIEITRRAINGAIVGHQLPLLERLLNYEYYLPEQLEDGINLVCFDGSFELFSYLYHKLPKPTVKMYWVQSSSKNKNKEIMLFLLQQLDTEYSLLDTPWVNLLTRIKNKLPNHRSPEGRLLTKIINKHR